MKNNGIPDGSPSLWGPKEVAEKLGVSERSATRYMRDGKIRSAKFAARWRTTRGEVLTFIEREFDRVEIQVDENTASIRSNRIEIQELRREIAALRDRVAHGSVV